MILLKIFIQIKKSIFIFYYFFIKLDKIHLINSFYLESNNLFFKNNLFYYDVVQKFLIENNIEHKH